MVIAIIVALSILLVSSLYLIVYYQHPDDHNDAYAPKLVVMLGFCLAGWTVLMFPLDVANNEGYAGTYSLYQRYESPSITLIDLCYVPDFNFDDT